MIESESPLKLLLDTNLRRWALRAEGVVKQETLNWGGVHDVTVEVHGYRGKELPDAEWKLLQLKSLPTVARLAKENQIQLLSSTELQFEGFHSSRSFEGFVGDIFAGTKIGRVPAAVERSYFWSTTDLGKYMSGDNFAGWCRDFLLQLKPENIRTLLDYFPDMPEIHRESVRNVSRYQEICRYLKSNDHIRDAFHMWTAEVNGLDYFLTGDRKFINVMNESTPITMKSPPISPSKLLETMGIDQFDPLPLTDRKFQYFIGGPPSRGEPRARAICRRLWNKFRKAAFFRVGKSGDQK